MGTTLNPARFFFSEVNSTSLLRHRVANHASSQKQVGEDARRCAQKKDCSACAMLPLSILADTDFFVFVGVACLLKSFYLRRLAKDNSRLRDLVWKEKVQRNKQRQRKRKRRMGNGFSWDLVWRACWDLSGCWFGDCSPAQDLGMSVMKHPRKPCPILRSGGLILAIGVLLTLLASCSVLTTTRGFHIEKRSPGCTCRSHQSHETHGLRTHVGMSAPEKAEGLKRLTPRTTQPSEAFEVSRRSIFPVNGVLSPDSGAAVSKAPESRREKLKNSVLAVLGRPNNLDIASRVIDCCPTRRCEKRRTRRQGGISFSACSTCLGASSKARITSSFKESDSWCWVGTSNVWPKTTPSCSLGKNGVSWNDNGAKTEHGGNGCS